MSSLYGEFAALSEISAPFAERLLAAGALTELERLFAKRPEGFGEAAECDAGANPRDTIAQLLEKRQECFTAFAQSEPQVSRSGAGRRQLMPCLQAVSVAIIAIKPHDPALSAAM